jgi:hypothetical protein
MQTKPAEIAAASEAREARERDYATRIQSAVSTSVNSVISIGDLFKDLGSRGSVKFPEKMVKTLEQKLQGIAMGKDPVYVLSILLAPLASCAYRSFLQIYQSVHAQNGRCVLWTAHTRLVQETD